jgi:hypothetical protein
VTLTLAELSPSQRVRWYQRAVTSFRLRWPDGVLDACEELAAEHPAWSIHWTAERGYHALHMVRTLSFRLARGATPDELVAAMAEMDRLCAARLAERSAR